MKWWTFIFLVFILASCNKDDCIEASGDRWNYDRIVDPFHTVELAMSADAYIKIDTTLELPVIRVVAQDNIVDRISSEVANGKLRLFFNQCIDNNTGIRFFISTPTVRTIIASGSGDVYSQEILELDSLNVLSRDNGDMDLTVNTHYLQTQLTDAGDLTLQGYSTHFESIIDASGDIYAFDMPSDTVTSMLNSSGNLSTRVENQLNVILNSSGDLYYKGSPQISSQINSTGEIIDAN